MLRAALKGLAGLAGFEIVRKGSIPADMRRIRSDFTAEEIKTVRALAPYTQTSPERLLALIRAVEYIVKYAVPGDIVECGVWKGGSMMAAAQTLLRLGVRDRDLYLYDTFEGMSEPTERDVSHYGVSAPEGYRLYRDEGRDATGLFGLNVVSLDEVKQALGGTGYPPGRMHFVKGKVEETLPGTAPERIAILRLDTDWYASTRHEMEHLFPRLARGGVLIVDDYGEWQGARQAVDEYVAANRVQILLQRIDYTGRIAVKL